MSGNVPGTYGERVCVVIAGEGRDDDIRRCLGDSLPIHIVYWPAGDYLEALAGLRPQVIVVVSEADQFAGDTAKLVAQLASPEPTVISLTSGDDTPGSSQLLIHQLGRYAAARIGSLGDLILPPAPIEPPC